MQVTKAEHVQELQLHKDQLSATVRFLPHTFCLFVSYCIDWSLLT